MKKTFVILTSMLFLFGTSSQAQKYFTRDGKIGFFSDASMEKIEAHNNSATSVIDMETGAMEFAVLIKGFQFEKALMQEHFNENYLESSKYPKSVFKGKFTGFTAANLSKDGSYPVKVKGQLTLHGVTKDIETDGQFTVKNGAFSGMSSFNILVADYNISVPAVVRENIAKEVRIDVACNYQEFNK